MGSDIITAVFSIENFLTLMIDYYKISLHFTRFVGWLLSCADVFLFRSFAILFTS